MDDEDALLYGDGPSEDRPSESNDKLPGVNEPSEIHDQEADAVSDFKKVHLTLTFVS